MRHFQGFLHLRGRKCKDFRIATGARAVHETRIREQIGRAPQELDAGALLLRFQYFRDGVKILVGLRQIPAFRGHVAIMPAIIGGAQFFNELKGHAGALLRVADGVGKIVPGPLHGAGAKRIAANAAKGVPIDDGKAQMVTHGLALHDFFRIVMLEGQRILGLEPFVTNFSNVWEC